MRNSERETGERNKAILMSFNNSGFNVRFHLHYEYPFMNNSNIQMLDFDSLETSTFLSYSI